MSHGELSPSENLFFENKKIFKGIYLRLLIKKKFSVKQYLIFEIGQGSIG